MTDAVEVDVEKWWRKETGIGDSGLSSRELSSVNIAHAAMEYALMRVVIILEDVPEKMDKAAYMRQLNRIRRVRVR